MGLNSIRKYFHELLYLLGDYKNKLPSFIFLFLCVSLLDVIGIGLIVPYVQIIVDYNSAAGGGYYDVLAFMGFSLLRDDMLITLSIILIVIFAIKSVAGIYIEGLIARFSETQRAHLQNRLMSSYQYVDYLTFISKNTAYYINLIQSSTLFHGKSVYIILKLISNSIVIIIVSSFLIINEPLVFASLFSFLAFLAISYNYSFGKKIKSIGRLNRIFSEKMLQAVKEGMRGYKEIRILGKELYFHKKVSNNSIDLSHVKAKFQILSKIPRYLFELAIICFLSVSVIVSVKVGHDVKMLASTFALFGIAAIRLMPLVNYISEGVNNLTYARDHVSLLYNDLKSNDNYEALKKERKTNKNMSFVSIDLKDVSFSYSSAKLHSLNNITMSIRRGESIGIVGASGSGKTTLVNMILGLINPQKGSVSYNGKPLIKHIEELYSKAAYLPQEAFILDDTLKKNIALGVEDHEIDDDLVYASLQQSSLTSLVEELPNGIETFLGEDGVRLSGGQRQRVVIARAFYHGRDLFVMDESTSALDNKTEQEIISEIKKLKGLKTLIVIAHRMSTVEYCDRIYSLNKGRIKLTTQS